MGCGARKLCEFARFAKNFLMFSWNSSKIKGLLTSLAIKKGWALTLWALSYLILS